MLFQTLTNVVYGIVILSLLIQVVYLTGQIRQLKLKNQRHYIEHKDDAKNLEEQIEVIAGPSLFVRGRRPTPIMPVPGQIRDADRKGEPCD